MSQSGISTFQKAILLSSFFAAGAVFAGAPGTITPLNANGQPLVSTQSAVGQTQQVLTDPGARNQLIEADPKAQAVDKYVESLTKDPQDKQQMYDLSAELFPVVLKMAGDDPAKLQQILTDAVKHPDSFLQSLPADAQAKIHALSSRLEKKSPASVSP